MKTKTEDNVDDGVEFFYGVLRILNSRKREQYKISIDEDELREAVEEYLEMDEYEIGKLPTIKIVGFP